MKNLVNEFRGYLQSNRVIISVKTSMIMKSIIMLRKIMYVIIWKYLFETIESEVMK